jgi:hypothetical protein
MTGRPDLILVPDPDEQEPFGDEDRLAALSLGRRVRERTEARAPSASESWWNDGQLTETMSVEDAASILVSEKDGLLIVDDRVPCFQVVGTPPSLAPVVAAIVGVLRPVCADERTVLAWFLSPKAELGGLAPARWVAAERNDAELFRVARRDATRLGA